MNEDLKIIFFGTPEFSVSSLQALIEADFNIVGVVTQLDKPVGRKKEITPPPVKLIAENCNIQIIQPETFNEETGNKYIKQIKNLKPDLFVIVAYGKILPQELLDIPKHGSINIHPSMLPKYRGPSPIQAQILADESDVGVSIMLIDDEMDHGAILARFKIKDLRLKNENYESLGQKLFTIGAEHLPETIEKYISGEIKPQVQNHTKATFTKLIKKEDGLVNWNKPASYIEQMTRAYSPWPGTFGRFKTSASSHSELSSESNSKTLKQAQGDNVFKILKARVGKDKSNHTLGTAYKTSDNELAVACSDKSVLIIDELQPSGKQKMTAAEFINGQDI